MNKKNETGAVTEDDFEIAFLQTPVIEITSLRELRETMCGICQRLHSDDWQYRVDNLRQIRSVFKGSQLSTDDFLQSLKNMDLELKSCVSDLRSQVVREACITVAYLSKEMKNKLDILVEQLLESLLNLVPNGAKIMSSSGKTALKIIVFNTQSVRILPFFLASVSNSKSTTIRQFSSEIVKFICEKWQTKNLDKNVSNISETLKKGISDADEQARANSREAFCWFNMKYPQSADKLLQSLDSNKQKALQRELSSFSGDGSTEVIDNVTKAFKIPAPRPVKSSSVSAATKVTNTVNRNRINSTKSDNQSANSSTEYLYVKPQSGFGFRGAKPKIPTPKIDTGDVRGRQTKIAQSQPATREPSPSPQSTYITYTNGVNHETKTVNQFTKRGTQNAYSSLRYKEMESEVVEKFRKTRKNSHDYYQSDDNASETSSVVSDNMPSFNELIVLLNSKMWNDRKRGLNKTERYIIEYHLKPTERKALIEIFNSMFLENQTVVVKKFLLVLYMFVDKYHDHINDWLNSLIGKLLNIHSNDRLKSCKPEVNKILMLTIDHFGPPVVFGHCCKYLIDKTQELSIKLKISLLEYMKNILTIAQPSILDASNSDIGPTLGNIVVLTAETKSTELRKLSSSIVIKLFDLNSAQFTRLLKTLPNTFQDRATSILDTYISNHKYTKDVTASSDVGDSRTTKQKMEMEKTSDFIKINTEALQNMSLNCDNFDKHSVVSNSSNRSQTSPNNWGTYQKGTNHNPFFQNKQGHIPVLKPTYNNYSPAPNQMYDSSNIQKYLSSQNSHPDLSTDVISNPSPSLYPATSNDSNVDNKYNPEYYSSGPIDTSLLSKGDAPSSNAGSITKIHKPVIGYQTLRKIAELAPEDVMSEILKELSNHNDRHEERKACLFKLIKIFRENTPTDWEEHFKTLLFLLLETMGDNDAEIRAQALRVLQELAKCQGSRFLEYTQLTILRVLEAHKDQDKSVVKAAEECSRELTTTMPRQLCLKMLIDIIGDGNENQLCLAALKMLIKLTKTTDRQYIDPDLENMCEALSLVVNHKESQVRKESILCLVEVHKLIGEDVWTRVNLTNSQKRLLEVYIKKNIS